MAQILKVTREHVTKIRKSVMEAVGSDHSVLTDMVPSLSAILDDDSDIEKDFHRDKISLTGITAAASVRKQNMWNRLTFIFKQLQ